MDIEQSAEMKDLHRMIAVTIDRVLNGDADGVIASPKKNGFVVLTFPFNRAEQGHINYASNAARADMLVALKEIVARFEGQADQSGRA